MCGTSFSPLFTLSFGSMGRGYIVEDAVEGYLSKLCEQQPGPVTGLLIGQVKFSWTSVCRLAFSQ